MTCCSLATAGDGLLYNTATDKQNGPIGDYLAAEIVTGWLRQHPGAIDLVVFNVFSDEDRGNYEAVLP